MFDYKNEHLVRYEDISKALQVIGEQLTNLSKEINQFKYEREKLSQTNYNVYKKLQEVDEKIKEFETKISE